MLRNWTRPENIPLGQRCRIYITQLPGGDVMSAKVDPSCPYDELGRRSVEAAVLKAKPLPYAGLESVFPRTLILNFEAQDRYQPEIPALIPLAGDDGAKQIGRARGSVSVRPDV